MKTPAIHRGALAILILGMAVARMMGAPGATPGPAQPPSSGSYRVYKHDLLKIIVQGEFDAGIDRRIDSRGEINMPLLGPVKVTGLTIAEAQELIAKRYVDAEIYIHPEVFVSVSEYSPREVIVLGCVGMVGKVRFPAEATNMTVVEAIASAGGFTRLTTGHNVRLTRKDENGVDQTTVLDVENMIEGKGHKEPPFLVEPGDLIFVPERVF